LLNVVKVRSVKNDLARPMCPKGLLDPNMREGYSSAYTRTASKPLNLRCKEIG
jgi:hypothetical protein